MRTPSKNHVHCTVKYLQHWIQYHLGYGTNMVKKLQKLWDNARMNFTPNIHGGLAHTIEQVRRFEGIGDILEDDLEHLHQTAARIYSCIGGIQEKKTTCFFTLKDGG
jgi:hypothetical protein